jgi:hypothetical protein
MMFSTDHTFPYYQRRSLSAMGTPQSSSFPQEMFL